MGSTPSPASWMESGQEAGLLLRAQQGGVDSYWELIHHYRAPVYRMAFALTRQREVAELLMQHVLVQGWRNLQQLQIGRPFLPWLLRLMRGQAIVQKRSPTRRVAPRGAASPRSRPAVFNAAFAELNVDEQILIALNVVERQAYAEIGTTLDMPAHTALSRLSAARERLRARVAAQQGGDA